MKFSKLSQLFLVSSIGLLVATLLTACQLVTIDYVFVASSAGYRNRQRWTDPDLRGGRRVRRAAHRAPQPCPPAAWIRSPWRSRRTTRISTSPTRDNTVVHFAIAANGVLTRRIRSP